MDWDKWHVRVTQEPLSESLDKFRDCLKREDGNSQAAAQRLQGLFPTSARILDDAKLSIEDCTALALSYQEIDGQADTGELLGVKTFPV
jgi:hypothetical protein